MQGGRIVREIRVYDQLALRAQSSGENAFTYGRLHAKEEALAAATERDFLDFWDSSSRPSLGGLRTKQSPS